jgi:hypothetical protein
MAHRDVRRFERLKWALLVHLNRSKLKGVPEDDDLDPFSVSDRQKISHHRCRHERRLIHKYNPNALKGSTPWRAD